MIYVYIVWMCFYFYLYNKAYWIGKGPACCIPKNNNLDLSTKAKNFKYFVFTRPSTHCLDWFCFKLKVKKKLFIHNNKLTLKIIWIPLKVIQIYLRYDFFVRVCYSLNKCNTHSPWTKLCHTLLFLLNVKYSFYSLSYSIHLWTSIDQNHI